MPGSSISMAITWFSIGLGPHHQGRALCAPQRRQRVAALRGKTHRMPALPVKVRHHHGVLRQAGGHGAQGFRPHQRQVARQHQPAARLRRWHARPRRWSRPCPRGPRLPGARAGRWRAPRPACAAAPACPPAAPAAWSRCRPRR